MFIAFGGEEPREAMKMQRTWDMPNANTFDIPSIALFVRQRLRTSKVSIDPFARNRRWATHTNDLNPNTAAQHNLESADFLKLMVESGVIADLVIFDPPYSPGQCKQVYDSIGIPVTMKDAQMFGKWREQKDLCEKLLSKNGVFLHFGWHSNGMGESRGWEIEEVLLVSHGSAHYDTICIAERRTLKPENGEFPFVAL